MTQRGTGRCLQQPRYDTGKVVPMYPNPIPPTEERHPRSADMRNSNTMPTPYTTEDTGYPVGLYLPGYYYTPEYLAYRREHDAQQPVPYNERHFDADEAVKPKPAPFRTDEIRVCVICETDFTPRGYRQVTCGDPDCRRKNRNARSAALYAKSREAA